MKRLKRLLSLLLCALLLCSVQPFNAAAADQSTLVVGTAEGLRGDTVTVNLSLTSVSGIASGGFTITYDSSVMSVESADAGEALSGGTTLINKEYSSNAIRISFMGSTPLSSAGTLASIQFKIKEDAAPGNYPLTASNVKFSDINANVVSREAVNGSISVRGVSISLDSAEITAGQGFDLDLCIQPPLAPCAGNVTLKYDSAVFSCGSVTPVKKMGDTPITLQYSVDAEKGMVYIGWMAEKPISDFGKLCSIHFESDRQAVGAKDICFTSYSFVDQDGLTLPCEAPEKAVITVSERPDDLPKLYFSDSSLEEESGIVTVSVLVDGADLVCAGNVKINYDASAAALLSVDAKYAGLVVTPEQVENAEGCIQFAWISAVPQGKDVCLAELKFQLEKSARSELVFSDVQLCDKDGLSIVLFDLENTAIFGQKQLVKITEISTGMQMSELNIRIDESIPSSSKVILAAYDTGGRFKGLYVCTAEDMNGARGSSGASVSFVRADSRKLFLITSDCVPICEAVDF